MEDRDRTKHRRVELRGLAGELAVAHAELAIFHALAEASTQGFSMAEMDGRITYINPALSRMLGERNPEDAIGKHLSAYFSEESNRRGDEEIRPALGQKGSWEGELPMLSRQGRSIPTWHHTFIIRDEKGRPLRIAVVITDITERKKAEEALLASEARYRCLFDELRAIHDSLGDGLLVADRQTLRLIRANASICSMLGYSEEELLSMSISDLHPKDALPVIVGTFQTAAAGRLPDRHNVPMVRKNGSLFYVDITGNTLTYRGRPCTLGLFRDVTERRQAQTILERERRTLKRMLRASDHERQLIAYDIHDGLAQHLAAAILQLQVYDHQKSTNPGEARTAYEQGLALLRQGHVEARRLISGVRPPILDESGVVAAVAHLVHDPAFDRGPKVEFRSKVTFGRLDPVLENVIYRIVQEGLSNARNHSRSEKVRVALIERGDHLRIEVRDWGIGFDPTKLPRTHFGLEGIRERARLLRGKCRIKSKPGAGTSIVVDLPLLEPQADPLESGSS